MRLPDHTHLLGYIITLSLIHYSQSQITRTKNQLHCDYELTDESKQGRGVKRLDFDCITGTIKWHGPYGGLFIQIHGPAEEHRLCVQLRSVHTSATISYVPDDTSLPNKLLTLNATTQKEREATNTRCFPARGATLLMVEADIDAPVSSQIYIDYDVDLYPRYGEDACRPCTEEELLYYYCTSDFVAIGEMLDLKNTAAANIISASIDLLAPHPSTKYFTKDSTQARKYTGQLYSPSQCDMHYGAGKFIFMGKMKFGRAELRCAPTYEDFYELQRTTNLKHLLLCKRDKKLDL